MKFYKRIVALFLTTFIIISAGVVSNAANYSDFEHNEPSRTEQTPDFDFVPGQAIVVLKDEAVSLRNQMKNLAVNSAMPASNLFPEVNILAVKDLTAFHGTQEAPAAMAAGTGKVLRLDLGLNENQSLFDAIELLKQNPNVKSAQPNYIAKADKIPNDPMTDYLDPMLCIEADKAWNNETGKMNVKVGVLDTGIDFNHEDLMANIDMSKAYNTYEENDNVMDIFGHGTHVSGTIGAKGNNGVGIAGVNWDVTIVPIKINFDDIGSYATIEDTVEGFYYAETIGLDIVNLSYSFWSWGSGEYPSLEEAVNDFSGLVIGSAGNHLGNLDESWWFEPFDCENLILVGSSTNWDYMSDFSCYGKNSVHLFAPGDDIYSTVPGGYGWMGGTSMAAPMVAGVAALLKSYVPTLTVQEIKAAIIENVDEIPDFEDLCITGGRLNAFKALQSVVPPAFYNMDLEVYSGSLENYNFNGTECFILLRAYDDFEFIPHLYMIDKNGEQIDANDKIESVTYIINGIAYNTGFVEMGAWYNDRMVTIEFVLKDGTQLSYSFTYDVIVRYPEIDPYEMDLEVYSD